MRQTTDIRLLWQIIVNWIWISSHSRQIWNKSTREGGLLAALLNTDWGTTKGFSAELYCGSSSSRALWGRPGRAGKRRQRQPATKLHLSHLKRCPPPPRHQYARRSWRIIGGFRGKIKLWINNDLFFIRRSWFCLRLITDWGTRLRSPCVTMGYSVCKTSDLSQTRRILKSGIPDNKRDAALRPN